MRKKQSQSHGSADSCTNPHVQRKMIRDRFKDSTAFLYSVEHRTDNAYRYDTEQCDMSPGCISRRTRVLLDNMARIQKKRSRYPGLNSIEETFIRINTAPATSYDLMNREYNCVRAAAIWMLDAIRSAGQIQKLFPLLPSALDTESWLQSDPGIDVVGFDIDTVNAMTCLLENRSQRTPGQHVRKILTDSWSLMEPPQKAASQKRLPLRSSFDAVLALLPEEDVKAACLTFEKKIWELMDILFQCHEIAEKKQEEYNEQVINARKELKRLKASVQSPLYVIRDPEKAEQYLAEQVSQISELLDKAKNADSAIAHLEISAPELITASPKYVEEQLHDRQLAELLTSLTIEDPYEICFAALYLLDTGSDLPWIYFPAAAVFSAAGSLLPWAQGDILDSESSDDYGFSASCIYDRLGLWDTKKSTSGGIYTPKYDIFDPYTVGDRQNFAQLIYKLSGTVLPRSLHPFERERELFLQKGLDKSETDRIIALSEILFLNQFQVNRIELNEDLDDLLEKTSGTGKSLSQKTDPASAGASQKQPADNNASAETPPAPASPALPELQALQTQNEKLKSMVRKLESSLAHMQNELTRQTHRQKELEERTALERKELAQLREIVFNEEQETEPELRSEIRLPYEARKRTVVFGGHETWRKAIKALLPGIRFIDSDMLPSPDLIRNADVVWIQHNKIGHAYYHRIMNVIREYGTELNYFAYASAEKCARQLAEADRR